MRPWPAVRARRQTAAAVPVGRSRRAAGRAAGRREECRGWWTWRENSADWAAVEGGRDILPAAATRGLPSGGRAQTHPRLIAAACRRGACPVPVRKWAQLGENLGMNALNIVEYTHNLGVQAKVASAQMARASAAVKSRALLALARLLRENVEPLQTDNARDLDRAVANGLSAPMVDRLRLPPKVLETCAQGCEQLASMADVIGEIIGMKQMPSGIRVGQMRVPIGVFGMIYESRPNVTIEAASLSIKSGNACILRGGSEAIDSNKALAALVARALAEAGLPEHGVQLVQTTDREAVGQLIAMPDYVDVIIPRGGKGLIERISREAKVPVIRSEEH